MPRYPIGAARVPEYENSSHRVNYMKTIIRNCNFLRLHASLARPDPGDAQASLAGEMSWTPKPLLIKCSSARCSASAAASALRAGAVWMP